MEMYLMKKIGIILIALMIIGLGFVSGCTNQSQKKNPTAECSANPSNGTAPLIVYFTGSGNESGGTIISYHWDFDDGTGSYLQNPTHTFTNAGTFIVRFTVTDNNMTTGTCTISITVRAS
jgi:PKD repeat protein